MDRYAGTDNYGKPKTDYVAKIASMNDESLGQECYAMIYQSALCNNNPRADWHWKVDACYDEAKKRDGKCTIYVNAYDRCYAEHAG